jgi:hypothetical protein
VDGVDVLDGREQEGGWSAARANYDESDGRRRKLRDTCTPGAKTVVVLGKGEIRVFKGDKATEDERWVYITEVKSNGTKAYLCCACLKEFTGYDSKIISHKLRLRDGSVAVCDHEPTAECRLVLERVKL